MPDWRPVRSLVELHEKLPNGFTRLLITLGSFGLRFPVRAQLAAHLGHQV